MATVLFTLVAYSFKIKAQASSPCLLPRGLGVGVWKPGVCSAGALPACQLHAGRPGDSPVFSDLAPLSSGIWEGVMKASIGKLLS